MKIINLFVLICMILLLGSCSNKDKKEATGTVYVFQEDLSSYPDFYNKYSELDVAEFIREHPPADPFTDTVFVTEFIAMEAFDDFLPEGVDSMLLAFLSFIQEGEDLAARKDSIIAETLEIRVRNGQLEITERKYHTIAEMMQEASADRTETDVTVNEEDDEPVYWINIFPERNARVDPLEMYYETVSAREVFDLIYFDNYIPEQFTDTATLNELLVTEASLVSVLGMGDKNYDDSLIIVYISYYESQEALIFESEAVAHYELYVLQVADGLLYELVSWDMGVLFESYSRSYSSSQKYRFELFQVSESASLIGIYNDSEEGSEYEGESISELSLYAIDGNELSPVLLLDLGSSMYEAEFQGPPEEQYSRSEIFEGQIRVTDELYQGFYKIEFIQKSESIENGEVFDEWTETIYFRWTGSMYSPEED